MTAKTCEHRENEQETSTRQLDISCQISHHNTLLPFVSTSRPNAANPSPETSLLNRVHSGQGLKKSFRSKKKRFGVPNRVGQTKHEDLLSTVFLSCGHKHGDLLSAVNLFVGHKHEDLLSTEPINCIKFGR
jgi:hypothetical protein